MKPLHIVQGGVENGDKSWLEKAVVSGSISPSWIAPKSAAKGDDVVIFVGGFGFFATATVIGASRPRRDWVNRHGAPLGKIRLIKPPISLGVIRRRIPLLAWAAYPRSVHTPKPNVADKIRSLCRERREQGVVDFDDLSIDDANIEELRAIALLRARPRAPRRERVVVERARRRAISKYVLERSTGVCEACGGPAPFRDSDDKPFLECHHMMRVADDGPDHPRNVIAVCPNCHRRAHHAIDAKEFNARLIKKISIRERGR